MHNDMKKEIKINWGDPVNQIRPRLYKYLSSIANKIDGRSYQKLRNTFAHKDKTTMQTTYDNLKETTSTEGKKVTFKKLEEVKEHKKVLERKTKAVDKIIKTFRNSVILKSSVTQKSDKFKTFQVDVHSSFVGKHIIKSQNMEIVVRKAYYEAMKHIDHNSKYKFYTKFIVKRMDTGEDFGVYVNKKDLEPNGAVKLFPVWFKEAIDKFRNIFSGYQEFSYIDVEFVFTKILSGGAHVESRDKEEIYTKKSVVRIRNNDNSCFWHAMAILLNKDSPNYKKIKERDSTRGKIAKQLCQSCCMNWDEQVGIDQIPIVEAILKCNIYVIDIDNLPMMATTLTIYESLLYKARYTENYTQCWLLFDNNHYNVITNPKGFLCIDYFCPKCCGCFHHKNAFESHTCSESTEDKHSKDARDKKFYKDAAHFLHADICKGSKEEVDSKNGKLKIIDKIEHPTYIIYDFETDTHSNIHKTNLCIATKLKVRDDHSYEKSVIETKYFYGYDCLDEFCKWLFQPANSNSTVIAHNQAGYDGKFVLSWCIGKGLLPQKYIQQGSRITYMTFAKYHLRFIDSLHSFLCPLSELSKTYSIDTVKGYFPHHFNIKENQNYIGQIPPPEDFGVKNMSKKSYEGFKEWYSTVKDIDWNFKEEFIKYCRADVDLLAKSVLAFRKIFKTMLDIDPWRYTTLASLCMDIYKNKFMPENQIVGNGSSKPVSQVCKEWLIYLNDDKIIPEVPINVFLKEDTQYYKSGKHTFTVDGLDKKNKIVSEFNGCYFHGCKKCYPKNVAKFERTEERKQLLIKAGYTVNEIWECEWHEIKKTIDNKYQIEVQAREQNINVRDALFGGRTEAFKSWVKCNENQKIFYDDVTSLYPTVNALDDYAVGFKQYVNITVDDIRTGKFFGVAKVNISPPKDLYVPVIPDNTKNKLLFHLNDMTEITRASVELKKALEKGYTITKIHSALQYKKYNGLMKNYVGAFIKMKIENSGNATVEECDKQNKYHKDLGFNFEIQPENCVKNPGLRQVAKICLNSLWGKFGQRSNLDSYEFIRDYQKLVSKLIDPKLNTKCWGILNENCIEIRYNEDEDKAIEPGFISEITAVMTTANARMRLYDFISWIHPSQLIYCDTDSCIWLYDETNPEHKKKDNNDPTLPKSVQFGNGLGQWSDEFDGSYATEIVVGGAKSYAIRMHDGKTKIAQKGITLDCANSVKVNFDTIKDMILNDKGITTEERYQFKWNKTNKDVITTYVKRSIHSTVNSKRMLDGFDSLPFGYKIST